MYRVVKTGYIDMAHRIRGHQGKCKRFHGHTWKIELSLSSEQLDTLGMVIDFGEVGDKFFKSVDMIYDHTLVIGRADAKALKAECSLGPDNENLTLDDFRRALGVQGSSLEALGIHAVKFDLTAETFAKHLFTEAQRIFEGSGSTVHVDYARVYEKLHPTESYAEYTSDSSIAGTLTLGEAAECPACSSRLLRIKCAGCHREWSPKTFWASGGPKID